MSNEQYETLIYRIITLQISIFGLYIIVACMFIK